jgi:carbamoyl-phosphate synthase large subunit
VYLSLADRDKKLGVDAARTFRDLGFTLVATEGTAAALERAGIEVAQVVAKLGEPGVDGLDLIQTGGVQLVVNSPRGHGPRADGAHLRAAAQRHSVPLLTTASAAVAAARGMADWAHHELAVRTLQEYHRGVGIDDLVLSEALPSDHEPSHSEPSNSEPSNREQD